MFYHLLYQLIGDDTWMRIFRYITLRSAMALVTAFVVTFLLMPPLIRWLRKNKVGQPVRDDDVPEQVAKTGTPTMGGLAVIVGVVISMLLWTRFDQLYVWLALGIMVLFGAVGFVDDFQKIVSNNPKGLSGKIRLAIEILGSVVFVLVAVTYGDLGADLSLPFVWQYTWQAMPVALFVLFAAFVMVGTGNSVNLTDGMDGLAIGPVIVSAGIFTVLSYLAGHANLASYLGIPYIAGAGELTVFAAAIVGASLAFLWFNCSPASVFMGDTGSLSLGGALGAMAVLTHNEVLMVILGGVFVFEALSVIIQVTSFKLTGKRVFLIAPYHHSLERRGWKEQQIVVRMWIISIILGLAALSTLKLRFNIWG